jgi:prepilin-type N-terminal cleavage/methylation domain-containing protein
MRRHVGNKPGRQKRQGGFSLVETMLVCAVMGIVAGFAIPNSLTAISNLKLHSTTSDFSGLVQRARTLSEQGNTTYSILFGLPTGNGAYVDLNGNGQYDAGEPMIQFSGNANQVAAPAGATGKPTNLDASGGPLGWTATAGNISLNSRGFPCSGSPCVTNVNYIFYFSDTRYNGSGWAAVSITSAGHPKTWWWNGSSWTN